MQQAKQPGDRELSISMIAKLVDRDRSTVYRWCMSGKLPARQYGDGAHIFVLKSDLEKFLEDSKL